MKKRIYWIVFFTVKYFSLTYRLLNANKIVCVRGDTFRGLEKLSLLSLYDNQLKTLANDTFTPLKSIQTL